MQKETEAVLGESMTNGTVASQPQMRPQSRVDVRFNVSLFRWLSLLQTFYLGK